jgi:cyclophilin family peptidyl-prolyl cis-trans isomerase
MMANRTVTFETSQGTFTIELFEEQVPLTTSHFLKLAGEGFYDGLTFHRVIDGFMIQGGCPQGTGRGGPGFTIKDEFHAELTHGAPGMLSMANAGPDTGGSQFFITLAATPWLDGKHAVFGRVRSGLEVVEKIGSVPTGAGDRPLEAITITRLTISEV